jgi:mRNA interferase RelE/StbE
LSNSYRIAETHTYQKKISKSTYQRYYIRARERLYPQLKENPFSGPNIKRLKGDLSGIYRYRIGDYRLFYTIDAEKKMVYMLDLDNRKDAYKK